VCRRLKQARDSQKQPTQDLRPGLALFRPAARDSISGSRKIMPQRKTISMPQDYCVPPAEAGSGFNKPAYPGLRPPRRAPSWANPIFTPSGFEHSQFQSGAQPELRPFQNTP
jgi:hypothetical protein